MEYRNQLIAADQTQQESFDKTVLALSGGALGVTFAFIKDIVGSGTIISPLLITLAWILWGLSVCFNLISFFSSHLSLISIIQDIDESIKKNTFENFLEKPNVKSRGIFTSILNILSGSFFVIGVILTAIFVFENFAK